MRSTTAVMALVKGGDAGRAYHREVENELVERANQGLPVRKDELHEAPTPPRRRRKLGTKTEH